jgi:hypothetical protein
MIQFRRLSLRQAAGAVAVVAFVSAVVVLVFEQGRQMATATAASQRLDDAALAAQSDPAKAPALAAEVERQTAASLSRVQRQRVAGITALAAAAFVVALAKARRAGKPRAPAAI